jgi:hypothetical protein
MCVGMTAVELMPPGALRWLTFGERDLAGEVFGDALDAVSVRVFAWPAPWPVRAFVPGRAFGRSLVVYPRRRALRDFSRAPLKAQAVFVHELVHVWQARSGRFLPWAKLRAGDGPAAYAYGLDRPFAQLNIEQQASAVEDAFRAARGGTAPFPAEVYAGWLPFGAPKAV